LKYPYNKDKSITTRLNLVNIGNAQILTIPGEALPNIGYYLKRHMKGEHNLLFGLTNDAFGSPRSTSTASNATNISPARHSAK
jgi:hypothetical protein